MANLLDNLTAKQWAWVSWSALILGIVAVTTVYASVVFGFSLTTLVLFHIPVLWFVLLGALIVAAAVSTFYCLAFIIKGACKGAQETPRLLFFLGRPMVVLLLASALCLSFLLIGNFTYLLLAILAEPMAVVVFFLAILFFENGKHHTADLHSQAVFLLLFPPKYLGCALLFEGLLCGIPALAMAGFVVYLLGVIFICWHHNTTVNSQKLSKNWLQYNIGDKKTNHLMFFPKVFNKNSEFCNIPNYRKLDVVDDNESPFNYTPQI